MIRLKMLVDQGHEIFRPQLMELEQQLKKLTRSAPINPISEAQVTRLYAIATHKGWEREQVKDYLDKELGIDSTTEIEKKDYERICEYLETHEPHWQDTPGQQKLI